MPIENINLGTAPTGEGGDTLRESFTKVNNNFGQVVTSDMIGASDGVASLDSYGKLPFSEVSFYTKSLRGGVVLYDSFDRADATSGLGNNLGISDSGHSYTDIVEPAGGWGVDRPRYLGIKSKTLYTVSGINAGFAAAVTSDSVFELDQNNKGIFFYADGGHYKSGFMLRYIDENNWLAAFKENRNTAIRLCDNGTLSTLASSGVEGNSGIWQPGTLHACIWRINSTSIVITVDFFGYGSNNQGIRYYFLEADHTTLFPQFLSDTNVGLYGGDAGAYNSFSVGVWRLP